MNSTVGWRMGMRMGKIERIEKSSRCLQAGWHLSFMSALHFKIPSLPCNSMLLRSKHLVHRSEIDREWLSRLSTTLRPVPCFMSSLEALMPRGLGSLRKRLFFDVVCDPLVLDLQHIFTSPKGSYEADIESFERSLILPQPWRASSFRPSRSRRLQI